MIFGLMSRNAWHTRKIGPLRLDVPGKTGTNIMGQASIKLPSKTNPSD
jgi:hypothetical protein